jgi:hypothetical protein
LCAAHLMHITGGHPGCMAKIMERTEFVTPVEECFEKYEDRDEEIVKAVAQDIRKSIPDPLRNTFDVLSIFRRYNCCLLQKIIDEKLIEYKGDVKSLEEDLTSTYLVRRKSDGFIQDEIARRLLAIRLYRDEPDHFNTLCKKAKQIYEQDLQDSQKPTYRPELIALEGLYQELQIVYYQGEQTLAERKHLYKAFFADNGILRRYLKILAGKPDVSDIRGNFITLLEDKDGDWEFQFTVNFFLRDEHYNDNPYEEMLRQVKSFFA